MSLAVAYESLTTPLTTIGIWKWCLLQVYRVFLLLATADKLYLYSSHSDPYENVSMYSYINKSAQNP